MLGMRAVLPAHPCGIPAIAPKVEHVILKQLYVLGLACAALGFSGYASAATELQPHANLQAQLPPGGTGVFAGGPAIARPLPPWQPDTAPLFTDPPAPEGGWDALANILNELAPSVDTSLPPSPSDITRRLQTMLDAGRFQEALDIIGRREAQRQNEGAIGTDVQLMFLKGRALSGLGRQAQAIDVFHHMTTQYPELPEPWNNLAVEYARQNRLAMAADALRMALTAHPGYVPAQQNLGHIQLLMARETLAQAAQAGSAQAAAELRRLDASLQGAPAR